MKLSKKTVDGLEPSAKDFFEWDDDLRGFGVRVWPSGTKVYFVRYRQNGKQRFFKIGTHGGVTPEQARKEAKIILGGVAAGEDPQEEKVTRRKSITLAELCDDYLKATEKGLIFGKGGKAKKASTLDTDRGRIERHIKPLLGKKLVIDLTRADISGFVRDVIEGKTAATGKSGKLRGNINVTGGRGTAARTKGLLGGILTYAIERGVIESNPAAGVKTPSDNVRHRRFSDEELAALGKVIGEAHDQYPQTITFCKLTMLTGWRKSEIEGLRWQSLDLPRSTAVLDDSKEGRSVRPLGAAVVRLLEGLDRAGEYVLPTLRKGEHYGGGYASFKRLCARAGINDVSPHVARHTVVTRGQEHLGFSESLCGAVVGHRKSDTVTGGYTHFAPAFLVEVATAISGDTAKIMGFEDLVADPEA